MRRLSCLIFSPARLRSSTKRDQKYRVFGGRSVCQIGTKAPFVLRPLSSIFVDSLKYAHDAVLDFFISIVSVVPSWIYAAMTVGRCLSVKPIPSNSDSTQGLMQRLLTTLQPPGVWMMAISQSTLMSLGVPPHPGFVVLCTSTFAPAGRSRSRADDSFALEPPGWRSAKAIRRCA